MTQGDADYSLRVRLIKSGFVPVAFNQRGKANVWQRRFWEHTIRDDLDFSRHVDYIHSNPVKHGHVSRAQDWPFSSIHQYVREEHFICRGH